MLHGLALISRSDFNAFFRSSFSPSNFWTLATRSWDLWQEKNISAYWLCFKVVSSCVWKSGLQFATFCGQVLASKVRFWRIASSSSSFMKAWISSWGKASSAGICLGLVGAKIYKTYTSSTRTRRGGSFLKDIYKTFLIYRTCMRRAPAKPVRACTLRKWCPVSHVTFESPLRPSHFSLHSSHSTLHTSHFTLHTSHFTLHSSQSTLHTSHSTLHTSHFTVHTSHLSLLIAFFTLHTSHCTLHAPHFTLHSSHSTLHLIWALLTLSQLISSHLISSHMSPKLSWITSQYYY